MITDKQRAECIRVAASIENNTEGMNGQMVSDALAPFWERELQIRNENGKPAEAKYHDSGYRNFLLVNAVQGSLDCAREMQALLLPDYILGELSERATTHGTLLFYYCALGHYREGISGTKRYESLVPGTTSIGTAYISAMLRALSASRVKAAK